MGDDLKSKSAEVMKKMLTVGVGTIFLTEEALRGMVSEWKLPKEVISAIMESSRKTKNELFQMISHDVFSKIVDQVDPIALIQEFITRNDFELNIKIAVKPKKHD
ncbi:hypothetical protein WDW37_11470 [Bdellovibrionota bacterium FG-1]